MVQLRPRTTPRKRFSQDPVETDRCINHNKTDVTVLVKTPKTSQSLILQSLMTQPFVEKKTDKITNYTNLAIQLK